MARPWVDVQTIEHFLSEKWPVTVIELGTGTGAFSVYLATYCWFNGFSFHTFDTHKLSDLPFHEMNGRCVEAVSRLDGNYHREDVFSTEISDFIRDIVRASDGPALLYCDNGDKPREIKEYKDALRIGDFLGVHDFGFEVTEEDVPDNFSHPSLFEDLGSTNRILERVS